MKKIYFFLLSATVFLSLFLFGCSTSKELEPGLLIGCVISHQDFYQVVGAEGYFQSDFYVVSTIESKKLLNEQFYNSLLLAVGKIDDLELRDSLSNVLQKDHKANSLFSISSDSIHFRIVQKYDKAKAILSREQKGDTVRFVAKMPNVVLIYDPSYIDPRIIFHQISDADFINIDNTNFKLINCELADVHQIVGTYSTISWEVFHHIYRKANKRT